MVGVCLTFKEIRGPQRSGTCCIPHHVEHTLASMPMVGPCNFRLFNGHEMAGYCDFNSHFISLASDFRLELEKTTCACRQILNPFPIHHH